MFAPSFSSFAGAHPAHPPAPLLIVLLLIVLLLIVLLLIVLLLIVFLLIVLLLIVAKRSESYSYLEFFFA